MGKVNITEILNYISNYQLTEKQKLDLIGNENKAGKVYDYILKDIQKKFGYWMRREKLFRGMRT